MRLRLLEAPSERPVSLEELKAHLRVEGPDEDPSLLAMIAAAVVSLDGWGGSLGRAIMTQRWAAELDGFPRGGLISLPLPPLQSVEAVTYLDAAGASQTLAADRYRVNLAGGLVRVPDAPTTASEAGAVTVEFTAGWPSRDAVPANIRAAILLIAGDLYDNREAQGGDLKVNPALARLLKPIGVIRV